MSPRELYKSFVRRLLAPASVPARDSLDRLDRTLPTYLPGHPYWRGTLAAGRAERINQREAPAFTPKYRSELAYWVRALNAAPVPGETSLRDNFPHWQQNRLAELAAFVGAANPDQAEAWRARQSVVEIGPGPIPCVAYGCWRRAVAVDPLADGYVREKLVPPEASRVVFLASPGERVPLPDHAADLVICENCLDHVSDPARTLLEIRRLLRPGGLLWLLVDFMDYTDRMHPHAFSERKLRAILAEAGFLVRRDVIRDHHSHPEAHAEYRGLLVKPGAPPDLAHPHADVVVRAQSDPRAAHHAHG